jgi:hypothetical protein
MCCLVLRSEVRATAATTPQTFLGAPVAAGTSSLVRFVVTALAAPSWDTQTRHDEVSRLFSHTTYAFAERVRAPVSMGECLARRSRRQDRSPEPSVHPNRAKLPNTGNRGPEPVAEVSIR